MSKISIGKFGGTLCRRDKKIWCAPVTTVHIFYERTTKDLSTV